MADDKKKKSADEIVDEMAEDMGVDDDEQVAASDESAEDVMDDLGGIFGVSDEEEAEKESADEDDEEEAEEEASDEEASDEEEEKAAAATPESKKKAEKKTEKKSSASGKKSDQKSSRMRGEGIEGIFTPGEEPEGDSYLTTSDLGEFKPAGSTDTKYWVIAFLAFFVVATGIVLVVGGVDGVAAVLKGEYRERQLAEKERLEEEFRKKQLAEQNKFGNLMISGNPQYALITINGNPWYGQTSKGLWRALRITPGTVIQNLDIKEEYVIEISAPGFEPFRETLTEGKWQESTAGGNYSMSINANLTPKSPAHKAEFDQRLAPDVDTEYFGTITINSNPVGAFIDFNNQLLRDEKGEAMKTPATFDTYYVRDNTVWLDNLEGEFQVGERVAVGGAEGKLTDFDTEAKTIKVYFDDSRTIPAEDAQIVGLESEAKAQVKITPETGKLEEKKVNVDTTVDIGHKIEVYMDFPNLCTDNIKTCVNGDGCCLLSNTECTPATDTDCKYPRRVSSLQRQMWTCEFDEEKKEKALEAGTSLQEACDYSYSQNVDFNVLTAYIIAREEEKQRIIAQREALAPDTDAGTDGGEAAAEPAE